ncbi:TPA: hypothetical protein KFO73_003775 [Escherichia coli]|uniref:hypothetical protein n=1 Tax=Escherichia coli TaxID=562 RepID=UPI000B7CF8A4|nr:hypothetical protein [Escherichia coli]HBC9720476.1 hypothetical protein [Escherichia coli]HBN7445016.1 hypothetical protein [Escherichia coli]
MTDSTQTKDLYSDLRFIIIQQQSGRLDPTRAREAWKTALTDQGIDVISDAIAEVIFRLTRSESL